MALAPTVTSVFTSPALRTLRHTLGRVTRTLHGQTPTLHYFHQVDDPYSHLLLQALPVILTHYPIALTLHLVSPPPDSAAPDRERLQAWSRCDAEEIADSWHLTFVDPGRQPSAAEQDAALAAMLAAHDAAEPAQVLATWRQISEQMWKGDTRAPNSPRDTRSDAVRATLKTGDQWRLSHGHYLGGMLYFEGEWYWGVDRLHHLESRWHEMGLAQPQILFPAPSLALSRSQAVVSASTQPPVLDFFCSLRSPYTYLAIQRCEQLATHYHAELRLRFVLPMVMRGLPVPPEKRKYIVLDAKREAELLNLPFGRIADPVGLPTERGLAVLHRAIVANKGVAFLTSFMQAVWAEGIDAGSDEGLHLIAARAGLDKLFVAAALADQGWRDVAQANREELLAAGLWGVPSFRVNEGTARWGQDRLWLIERDLIVACGETS